MRRLVIRPGGIGDFILSLPALECLRADYLEIWTSPANVPLVRFAPTRSIRSTGLDLLGIAETPASLLEVLRGFDSIVSWYGANRPDFRELVSSLGLPFTFFPALPPADAPIHAADFYLAQIGLVASCSSDGVPRIECSQGPRENFAIIHPFSGGARKNWPIEKFRLFARSLERTMPVYWCRGMDDPPLTGAVEIENLYDLACWLARAALYVGNDSGITHLAAAVGTPVFAVFGPTDPLVWGPRGIHVRIARWNATAELQ